MAERETFNVTAAASPLSDTTSPHSPWHSPVPYLFGGLAAMLGLIAFALLILACSYWKLSGYLENGEGSEGDRDLEAGGEGKGDETQKRAPAMEQKFLVIMAGEIRPTFLGTPISSSRSSSFCYKSEKTCCCAEKGEELNEEETSNSSTADEDQHQKQQSSTQATQEH